MSLTSVTIPNSVISISEAAFKDCESLSDVYYAGTAEDWAKISIGIDNSKLLAANRHYKSTGPKIRWSYANGTLTIGGNGLMEKCYNISSGRPWDKYKEKITRVVIENGVTNIGSWAFYGYTGLKSVTIPNSVTNIGEFSFYGCAGLVGITIPDSVENIDDWAFRNCTGVKGITFNGKIPNMGSGAFDGVSNCTANYLCGKGSSLNYAAEAGGDITWKIIHTGNKIIDAAVSATYDKTGLTAGSHCSVCNEVITKQNVVPMKLVAAPKKVKAQSAGYASVRISWGKVSYATGYAVYRATSKKGTYKYIGKTSKNYYTDAKRTTGTTYYYKVRAYRTVNKANKYGAYSAIVYAKALPATPVLTAKNAGTRKIKLSWKKISGAHGYEIYRATSKNGKYALAKRVTSGSTLSFTNTRLTRGKTYYYKIRAYRTVKKSRKYGAFSTVKYAKG